MNFIIALYRTVLCFCPSHPAGTAALLPSDTAHSVNMLLHKRVEIKLFCIKQCYDAEFRRKNIQTAPLTPTILLSLHSFPKFGVNSLQFLIFSWRLHFTNLNWQMPPAADDISGCCLMIQSVTWGQISMKFGSCHVSLCSPHPGLAIITISCEERLFILLRNQECSDSTDQCISPTDCVKTV